MIGQEIESREEAVAFSETQWWDGKSSREIVEFQINVKWLCCPFEVFHEAVEKSLGRPVFTHEFADPSALIRELSP